MSVRLAIGEAELETLNVAGFCRDHGISRRWFYEIRRRFEAEGFEGLAPRSRAPLRVANRTPMVVEDVIVAVRKELEDLGLDAGAGTIRWHLEQRAVDRLPSEATIWRILTRRGFITPAPSKRPPRSPIRFAAERANECWQIDATHWMVGDGTGIEIINVVDDCTRVCVASRAVAGAVTGVDAWETLLSAAHRWGLPGRVLSDNGAPFTSKLFVDNLAAVGIRQGHSRPYHPQTCGKVERFHQTLKLHLRALVPDTLADLNVVLDEFRDRYNHLRPHRALGRVTPAQRFADTPKAGPDSTPVTAATSIHTNTVDRQGRVEIPGPYSISIGNRYTGATAITVRTGTRAHVFVDHRLARQLTLDLTKRPQPLHPQPGRPTSP